MSTGHCLKLHANEFGGTEPLSQSRTDQDERMLLVPRTEADVRPWPSSPTPPTNKPCQRQLRVQETAWTLKSLVLAAANNSASSRRTRIWRYAFHPSPNHSGLAAMSTSSSAG